MLPFVSGRMTDTSYDRDPRLPSLPKGPDAQAGERAAGVHRFRITISDIHSGAVGSRRSKLTLRACERWQFARRWSLVVP
jgi:hypothetical protein